VFDVYRLNVATGELKLVAENPGNITGWVTDHDGHVRVAVTTDGVTTSILARTTESEPFKSILTTNFKDQVEPHFFTFDNKYLYASSNLGRDKEAVVVMDLATGKEREMVYARDDVDVTGLAYSHKRKVLTTARFVTWKTERKFFDPQIEGAFRDVQGKLPGYEISFASADRAEDAYIVAANSDKTRGAQYLYDMKTKELAKLADISP